MLICQPVWIIKRKVDNLDVGKVNTDPVDLKRLSKVVDYYNRKIQKYKNCHYKNKWLRTENSQCD